MPTTTQPKTAKPIDRLAAAETRLAEVEARIASGDRTVTEHDLAAAASSVETARRWRAIVEAEQQRSASKARTARIAALKTELPARLSTDQIERARQHLADALDRFCLACREFDDERSAVFNELAQVGPLPADIVIHGQGMSTIVVGASVYRPAPTQATINREATAAIQRHYPRTQISLDRPRD